LFFENLGRGALGLGRMGLGGGGGCACGDEGEGGGVVLGRGGVSLDCEEEVGGLGRAKVRRRGGRSGQRGYWRFALLS